MNFLSKSAIILGSVAFALGCLFFRYIPNKWYKPKSTYYSTLVEHNKNQENQIIRDNEDIDKLNKNVILLEDQIKFLRDQIKKIEQETYYEFIRELPFRMDDERVQELIKAFEKIINELTNELGKKGSIIKDKDALIEKLQAIIKDLQNQLKDKDTLIKDKDALIIRIQAIIEDLKGKLLNIDSEIEKIQTFIKDLEQEIQELKQTITNLQNQLKDKKSQPILNDFGLLKPYLEYKVDGDIIREYKLFPEMEPKEKDHAGRVNYFHRQDFKALCKKYQLDIFPTKWTTNKENLFNLEYDQNGTVKCKNGWRVSKANFNIILTNQPHNIPLEMTREFINTDGFYNHSYCYLNSLEDCEIFYLGRLYSLSNYPYTRFITKNLECEFDWLVFILLSFAKHFPSNYQVLKSFQDFQHTFSESENSIRNTLSDNERLFEIVKTPKQIIVQEGTPKQYIKTIDIIEIKYDLKTLVDKVNNLYLTTEKEKKNREFINQYALKNQPLISTN